MQQQMPNVSAKTRRLMEFDRFLNPPNSHLLPILQPSECRNVVGPSRAAEKVKQYEKMRQENLKSIRATSEHSKQSIKALQQSRKDWAQRERIMRKQRLVAMDAAKGRSRDRSCINAKPLDDIVEAALVSVRSVKNCDQQELVLDGLGKLLPPIKRRPPGVLG